MWQIFPLHKVTFQKCQFENVLSFFNFPFILGGRTLVYPKVLLCSLLGIYLNFSKQEPSRLVCGGQQEHEESL